MSSSSNASRKENERTKLIQEKCQTLLTQMLRDEDNKYCVDCDAKGPRWASWNLGVFLCIRCAGIHRNLGVHISRVKSVNLDTWTPEQVISLQQMGNSRARAVYEAQLPDGFRRPQTDTALESFVRAKYEHKKYLAREWVPPSPPKVDWGKEIDEELERQKRKKKSAQINSVLGIGGLNTDRKGNTSTLTNSNNAKTVALPAPLPKPNGKNHGNHNNNNNNSNNSNHNTKINSPQSLRSAHNTSDCNQLNNSSSNDLLGLSSPTKPTITQAQQATADLVNDSFSSFLSATPNATSNEANKKEENTLEQEEEDFFNQSSLGGVEKDKAGKLTKDSILALYGAAPTANTNQNLFAAAQPQPSMFGLAPAYMGAAAGGAISHHPQQHQFMTPPNSTSMYNSPVMTAPTAFSAPGMSGMGSTVNNVLAYTAVRLNQSPVLALGLCGGGGIGGGGIMATGQQTAGVSNLMHNNNNQSLLLSGNSMMAGSANAPMMGTANSNVGMMSMVGLGMPMGTTSVFQNTATPAASGGSNTTGLNQQFGNLNIGNVWQ